jgi:hypothetical protein
MNAFRRTFTAVFAVLGFPVRAFAQSRESRDEAGKQLRLMVLGTKARELRLTPSPEFPRVFGVVMDWPVGDQIATVVALSDGTASLYTTSTFGIIGGQAYEPVRAAGKKFIATAERHYDQGAPVASFPYPANDQIAFYLLCYEDVRLVTAALAPTQDGTGKHVPLFSAGQEVLTQLRRTAGK